MDTPPAPQVTPTQAAETAVAGLMAARQEATAQARAAELDIRDPSAPPPKAPPSATVTASPGEPKPLPGASVAAAHTPELIERATALGYTEAEAKQIPPAVLRKTISRLETDGQAQAQVFYGPNGEMWDGQRWLYPQQAPAKPKEPEFPNLREWKDAEGNQLEPAIVEAFERQQAALLKIQKQNEELGQSLQQQQQHLSRAQQESYYKDFDSHVRDLKEYTDILGEGTIHQVDDAAKRARLEVDAQVQALAQNYQQRGLPVPDVKTLVERAVVALHGSRAQQKADASLDEKLRNRAGQFIAKPTATTRNDEVPFGRERAIAAVAAKQREMRNGN